MFNTGDVVIGNDRNNYSITCMGRRVIVVDVDEETDTIELKAHPEDAAGNHQKGWPIWCDSVTLTVDALMFDLWEENPNNISVPLLDFLMV